MPGAAAFWVDVKAAVGFLAKPLELAELVGDPRGDGDVLGLHPRQLARPPAEIEPDQIVHLKRPHRHAEAGDDAINLIGGRALQNDLSRLLRITAQHAVADETGRVAGEHGYFRERLTQLHHGRNCLDGGLFAAHHFQKSHHVGRAEEVHADHGAGPAGCVGHLVYV